ncbi:MAG TPA: gamma carbonic anhydrase family protein [Spirochaetota bacterium]|nr:gamma carbonic anhydrase family protein [Spirochaetota bacterium]
MLYNYKDKKPDISRALFIAPSADITGDVVLAESVSVWHQATLRADLEPVIIDSGTNVQEQCALHVDHGAPVKVGRMVTLGHGVILHGCTVEDGCMIGMGATVLNNAVIGRESIVGAGALITEGKQFPPRSLILGSPARAVKTVSDQAVDRVRKNSELYIQLARDMGSAAGKNYSAGGDNETGN